MGERPKVTLVVHRDGELENRVYRMPLFVYRSLKIGGIALAALIVVAAVLYTPIARTAARVPRLNREVARLSAENEQVRHLAQTLAALETRYEQVRSALGADLITDPTDVEPGPFEAHPIHARIPGAARVRPSGPSLPVLWPLDSLYHPGVMTRGQIPAGGGADPHPGIDIAVRSGTPIRAAGGGVVLEAGYDAEYGLYVLLEHLEGYRTLYGHASRLLVETGDSVSVGRVIALVGNTGRSTAPHLHFEKRRGDDLIDPLGELKRES